MAKQRVQVEEKHRPPPPPEQPKRSAPVPPSAPKGEPAHGKGKSAPAKKAKTVPYNPYAYVPGGSSAKVGTAIEQEGFTYPGAGAVQVPEQAYVNYLEDVARYGDQGTTAPPPEAAKPPPSDAAGAFLAGAVALSHADAFAAIRAACDLYGVELMAACADGLHEGFGGGIGDGGTAFGPWQEHLEDGRIPAIVTRGPDDPDVQRWAWSAVGIAHGVKGMAVDSPSAQGLSGHAAVHAIVYGFERPLDKEGAYRTRAAEYDHLAGMGAGWTAYVISLLKGPGLPGTQPGPPAPVGPSQPVSVTGAKGAFGELMRALGSTLPGKAAAIRDAGANLPGV